MLCLVFTLLLFGSHAYKTKFDDKYRKLSTHSKINHAYQFLRIFEWAAHCAFRPHHVAKHRAVLSPRSANILLWIIHPCRGFDLIISCSMLNPYLGLFVACTYPLSILQAIVVLGAFL